MPQPKLEGQKGMFSSTMRIDHPIRCFIRTFCYYSLISESRVSDPCVKVSGTSPGLALVKCPFYERRGQQRYSEEGVVMIVS
jgi:hypothetical protein